MYLHIIVLNIRKVFGNFYLPSIMSIVFNSLKHLKLYTCCSTASCLYLHDTCTSKFKYMNYIFANLVDFSVIVTVCRGPCALSIHKLTW